MSAFSYYPVIWMFCGKTMNAKINRVHKRSLQALHNDFDSSYEELLKMSNQTTVHEINKRRLLIEVYRCLHKESPSFLRDLFVRTEIRYNLRCQKFNAHIGVQRKFEKKQNCALLLQIVCLNCFKHFYFLSFIDFFSSIYYILYFIIGVN